MMRMLQANCDAVAASKNDPNSAEAGEMCFVER